jgi:hypothetical protein
MVRMQLVTALAVVFVPVLGVANPTSARTYPLTLLNGSRLMVRAQVAGRPVEALLDSAAEATFIDPEFARAAHLAGGTAVTGQGSGGASFEARMIKGVELRVFGITLKNQTVATADLADVGRRLLGRKLEVILGREIFDAARLRIDIAGGAVTVLSPDSTPRGVRIALLQERGVETLPVRIESHAPVNATFDLGNGSQVLIGANLAANMGLLTDGRPVRTEAGGGLGGEVSRQVLTLRSLEVAGTAFPDVTAAIDAQPSAADLNIGTSILKQFVITTDFAEHAVWLEPRNGATH